MDEAEMHLLLRQLDRIEERIAALEAQPHPDPVSIEQVRAEVDAAITRLAELAEDEPAETAAEETKVEHATEQASDLAERTAELSGQEVEQAAEPEPEKPTEHKAPERKHPLHHTFKFSMGARG